MGGSHFPEDNIFMFLILVKHTVILGKKSEKLSIICCLNVNKLFLKKNLV